MKSRIRTSWGLGANNIAAKDRLPDDFARSLVNLDPLPGGNLALRTGYEEIYAGTDVRGVLAFGRTRLLVADGTQLIEINLTTGVSRVLRTIAGAGPFVGDVLNDVLYFCTATECLEYNGTAVRTWGVKDVTVQPPVVAAAGGALQPGYYQIAMTYTDADGREGGTDKPVVLSVPAEGRLTVSVPVLTAGHLANIYIGAPFSETLYLQHIASEAGDVVISSVRDDTARCGTVGLRAPTPGARVVAHNAVLAVAVDKVVMLTRPMQAHLMDRASGFLQYPVPVGDMVSATFLYVSADRCYAVTDVETGSVGQRAVLEYPAIPGTAVRLPDGRGAWMTEYGQAVTNDAGAELLHDDNFVPTPGTHGASGVVDNNGNQTIVTSMKGAGRGNQLAASDFYIGEILNP